MVDKQEEGLVKVQEEKGQPRRKEGVKIGETRMEVNPELCQERERDIRLFYIEAKMTMFRI